MIGDLHRIRVDEGLCPDAAPPVLDLDIRQHIISLAVNQAAQVLGRERLDLLDQARDQVVIQRADGDQVPVRWRDARRRA